MHTRVEEENIHLINLPGIRNSGVKTCSSQDHLTINTLRDDQSMSKTFRVVVVAVVATNYKVFDFFASHINNLL